MGLDTSGVRAGGIRGGELGGRGVELMGWAGAGCGRGGARAWVRMLSVGLGLHGGFGGCPKWWLLCGGQRVWGFLCQGLNTKAPEDALVEAI